MKSLPDKAFIEKLYREQYVHMYRFAYLRLNDHYLAEEIVQDVFLLAYKKIKELRDCQNPQGWLVKTLGNTIMHALRTKQFIMSHFVEFDEGIEPSGYDIDSDLGLREQLSPEEWKLLSMIYNEGYSIDEAARMFGIKFETCRKRILRARKKIKNIFDSDVPF